MQMCERGELAKKYILPILGAALPIGVFIACKRKCCRRTSDGDTSSLLRRTRLDLQAATEAALKYVRGTPIEVELHENEGRPVWEVQIVPHEDGPIKDLLIDARNGDLLEIHEEPATGLTSRRPHPGHIPCHPIPIHPVQPQYKVPEL